MERTNKIIRLIQTDIYKHTNRKKQSDNKYEIKTNGYRPQYNHSYIVGKKKLDVDPQTTMHPRCRHIGETYLNVDFSSSAQVKFNLELF